MEYTFNLDYEDMVDITRTTLMEDIREHLSEELSYNLEASYRYLLVDNLLDALFFYSTEEEYQEFTEEIGGAYVALRTKALNK